jgi:hypothetical protein
MFVVNINDKFINCQALNKKFIEIHKISEKFVQIHSQLKALKFEGKHYF